MPKLRKKLNKKQLLWLGVAIVIGLILILTAVFVIMDSRPPIELDYQPLTPPPKITSPYKPSDFMLNEKGFMTCLTSDYATGIDVSFYQGEIDWQQVRDAGVEFVFIRVGRRGSTEGQIYGDELAQENYAGAKEAGLKIGAYFYSQAISPKEAEEEAWFVLKEIADWKLDLPVVFDWEWGGEGSRTTDLSPAILTQCNLSFCQIIENAGLKPMIYFNEHQGLEQMNLQALEKYPFWLAMYESDMDFPYKVDYWQYTQTGTVPGIEGDVDLNIYLPPKESE